MSRRSRSATRPVLDGLVCHGRSAIAVRRDTRARSATPSARGRSSVPQRTAGRAGSGAAASRSTTEADAFRASADGVDAMRSQLEARAFGQRAERAFERLLEVLWKVDVGHRTTDYAYKVVVMPHQLLG